eukprot:Selendium_serpulae@DN10294_c0_g1_i1.p1
MPGRSFANEMSAAAEPPGLGAALQRAAASGTERLLDAAHKLLTDDAAAQRDSSVYTGALGVAVALLRVAQYWAAQSGGVKGHSQSTDPEALLSLALRLSASPRVAFHPKRSATFAEGTAAALAIRAAVLSAASDSAGCRRCLSALAALRPRRRETLGRGVAGILYGRCGYLQALLFARRLCRELELGRAVATPIIDRILS